MRVGVYFPDFSPSVGGGFTMQAEILEVLVQIATESSHTFVIVSKSPYFRDLANSPENVQVWADLPPQPQQASSRSVISRIRRRLMDRVRPCPEATGWGKTLRDAGIEYLWVAGIELPDGGLDTPFLTNVWDLQHRLQPWFPEVSEGAQWLHRETVIGVCLRRASTVVVGTEAGREEVERFYQVPTERIRILPHPTPRFALTARASDAEIRQTLTKYSLSKGFIFYPAQFWAHKNHANLLFAVRDLREKHGIELQVAFTGSDHGNQGHIEELSDSLGLSSQVRFLGFVTRNELVALYRSALALTYVSFFGPENMPPLEAFALGCPVIAADVSGAREQLGDSAILVDPRNPGEIASAIATLNDSSELRRGLVGSGLKRASAYSGYDYVRDIFLILDEFEPMRRCWS